MADGGSPRAAASWCLLTPKLARSKRAVNATQHVRGSDLAGRGFVDRIARLASRGAQPHGRRLLTARAPGCRRIGALGDRAGEAPAGGFRDEPCARGSRHRIRGGQSVRSETAKAAAAAIEALRGMPPPQPLIGDAVERWLPVRLFGALHAAGIRTLADLTLRVPRRRRWWAGIAGLGPASAHHIEAFFGQHPALTERARPLIPLDQAQDLVPWERLVVPEDVRP